MSGLEVLEEGRSELASVRGREGMVVSEYLEDVEHGESSFVSAIPASPDDGEKVIERRFVLGSTRERPRQCEPRSLIRRIGPHPGLDLGHIETARGFESGGGLKTLYIRVGGQVTQHDEGVVGIPPVDEHARQAGAGFVVIALLLENLPEDVLGGHIVIVESSGPGLIHHEVELAGNDPLHPIVDRRFSQRAGEAVDLLAVLERGDRGDPLHLVLGGEFLVRVHVDLDEFEGPAVLVGHLLQCRTENTTRCTPRGPEVDDDGHFAAALENLLREIRGAHILDEIR
jgi:hypothetical protein